MKEGGIGRSIPPAALKGDLQLTDVDALLRAHGASIRSVDNHHWQISSGDRSGVWLLGDRTEGAGGCLDQASLQRLQGVLRQTGLLREQGQSGPGGTPMGAAILWVGNEATRVYWINDRDLAEGGSHALSHWLHGEIILHNNRRLVPYLRRIVAMLERIERPLLIGLRSEMAAPEPFRPPATTPAEGGLERLTQLLEEERPDLRERLVGVLTLDGDRLDDALLFAMACDYLLPRGG